ncbi:hypothetical protein ACIQAC_26105 [Streptomyces sp. NPDC088387]|uniref:hypothetical protein n=1 Tax=Streptomyces sp. NPDC088387 TaxID=3365859 RepID=UPI00380D864E
MPPPPSEPPQNPYGGQQPPPPSGPYDAQPPAGPYGAPPPGGPYGYPQQPGPGFGPWGAPPPPKRKRTGLVLTIVGGVVALVVVVVVGLAMIGDEIEDSFPEAEYRLAVPRTLLDERYELAQDMSDSEGQAIEDGADGAWDARDATAVVATYSLGGDDAQGTLVVSGMYGRFKNTDAARDSMMEGAAQGEGASVAVPPKDFTPGDSGITVTCEVVTQNQLGTEVTIPTCGWVDGNTGATVAEVTAESVGQDPAEVDLEAAAETAIHVREEMRERI